MNRFMKSQVDSALIALKALSKSLEMSALKDDGEISMEETKQIKQIRNAISKFEKKMSKIK